MKNKNIFNTYFNNITNRIIIQSRDLQNAYVCTIFPIQKLRLFFVKNSHHDKC